MNDLTQFDCYVVDPVDVDWFPTRSTTMHANLLYYLETAQPQTAQVYVER